ncbi:hypothetical protein SARC_10935 [Sphaeroforma arctica JP610]|uniref:Glycosyl hydrolase family 30 TIM-barrel domain-containing protein n=1 Tax=Sphaeroforma arctica JP610 TaxID=667725 RepID=A0A0L0FIK5_9EUKA|nr:hypothetical protein SARC_10935 [Sphaeroforma arctica JP610]KNC76570.1 hypothetical protein SARC_10935 [Sphaeroforma arctica JP610]|eukprot:XP_014150472.1 hypothetical protein SARC_10935 [Sphaeroforma arctica JP610]
MARSMCIMRRALKWGVILFVLAAASGTTIYQACVPYEGEYGIACVCSNVVCDNIEPLHLTANISANTAVAYTSSLGGKRLVRSTINKTSSGANGAGSLSDGNVTVVALNLTHTHQTILGFGGAITDATTGLVNGLDNNTFHNFLHSYWGPAGVGYAMARIPLGSTDFSRHSYTLAPVENDLDLISFALRDDAGNVGYDYKVGLAKHVVAMQPATKFLFAPWSAPVWMKSCNTSIPPRGRNYCGGEGDESSVPTYLFGGFSTDSRTRASYAQYFVKFIQAYAELGVSFWGLSAQNEPEGNPTGNKWENTNWLPDDLVSFTEDYLGPALEAAGLGHLSIMTGDGQFPQATEYGNASYGVGSSGKNGSYIDGIAYHWYNSLDGMREDGEAILGGLAGGGIEIRNTYELYTLENNEVNPGYLLSTEACTGTIPGGRFPKVGDWSRGYAYTRDILHQLNNGGVGWLDWNLALNTEGGPNHANNTVDSPVIVLNETHFVKNPMFYSMGHFSKFVVPGSKRLDVAGLVDSVVGANGLEVVAFKTPTTSSETIYKPDTSTGTNTATATDTGTGTQSETEVHTGEECSACVVVVLANDRYTGDMRPPIVPVTARIEVGDTVVTTTVGSNEVQTIVFKP